MAEHFDERSFGIIPLLKDKVLLVRLHSGGHWSFPKGHAEKGESPKETAERELFEETGLSVARYLSDEVITEAYAFQRSGSLIRKRVDYWIAEVEGDPKLQEEEIFEHALVGIKDVRELLTYPAAKQAWDKAYSLIT